MIKSPLDDRKFSQHDVGPLYIFRGKRYEEIAGINKCKNKDNNEACGIPG